MSAPHEPRRAALSRADVSAWTAQRHMDARGADIMANRCKNAGRPPDWAISELWNSNSPRGIAVRSADSDPHAASIGEIRNPQESLAGAAGGHRPKPSGAARPAITGSTPLRGRPLLAYVLLPKRKALVLGGVRELMFGSTVKPGLKRDTGCKFTRNMVDTLRQIPYIRSHIGLRRDLDHRCQFDSSRITIAFFDGPGGMNISDLSHPRGARVSAARMTRNQASSSSRVTSLR